MSQCSALSWCETYYSAPKHHMRCKTCSKRINCDAEEGVDYFKEYCMKCASVAYKSCEPGHICDRAFDELEHSECANCDGMLLCADSECQHKVCAKCCRNIERTCATCNRVFKRMCGLHAIIQPLSSGECLECIVKNKLNCRKCNKYRNTPDGVYCKPCAVKHA